MDGYKSRGAPCQLVHKPLGHVWLCVKPKRSNRTWFFDLIEKTFDKRAKVAGEEAKRGDAVTARPTFAPVMSFEFELRKGIMVRVRACLGIIDEGIKAVGKDAKLKELHLLTPFRFQVTAKSTGSG